MSTATGFPSHVVQLIWQRDRGCCARCGRGVSWERRGDDWAIHHRSPRGMGSTKRPWVNRAANGVLLCNACHDQVESERAAAKLDGFLVSKFGQVESCETRIRHALYGWVYLDDEGGVTPILPSPAEAVAA